jgi:hypothetical protein
MTDAPDLRAIESKIKAKVETHLADAGRGGGAYVSNRASELGLACDTYHVLRWLRPELWQPPDVGLKKIFRIGEAMERPNLRLVEDAGFKVVEHGRPYSWAPMKISAHIDAKIIVPELSPDPIPLEHKTLSPNGFRFFRKAYDSGADWHAILEAKYTAYRKYPAQLQVYELLDGAAFGAWMLFEKASGDFFFWIHALDLDYAESLLRRAERVNAAVAAGEVPTPVRCDFCRDCQFQKSFCFLGQDFGPGHDVILDPSESAEWEAKLDRYAELASAASEHDDLWDEIKERFGGKTTIVGSWHLETTTYLQKRKAQEAREIEVSRLNVTRL